MSSVFGERMRAVFAPPRYIAFPLSGIDLSTSGVKAVRLAETARGLILSEYAETQLPSGVFIDGEIVDRAAISKALVAAAEATGISSANIGLLPQKTSDNEYIDDLLSVFDQAAIGIRALEEETFAIVRALLPWGDESTTLIIDIGKTATKLFVVARRVPRFAATIGIGGHAFTLAVQKHFGVTEAEARKVKSEKGIVPALGNGEYLAAMFPTASAIRAEVSKHVDYWQKKASIERACEPIARAILAGGNASIRGLPEYFEETLRIPVATGDVFTNLASHDAWVPSLDYAESLAYTTAIGLALYDRARLYA
jgi:Tfp pilus assembly PilM family ATPase